MILWQTVFVRLPLFEFFFLTAKEILDKYQFCAIIWVSVSYR